MAKERTGGQEQPSEFTDYRKGIYTNAKAAWFSAKEGFEVPGWHALDMGDETVSLKPESGGYQVIISTFARDDGVKGVRVNQMFDPKDTPEGFTKTHVEFSVCEDGADTGPDTRTTTPYIKSPDGEYVKSSADADIQAFTLTPGDFSDIESTLPQAEVQG